MQPAADMIYKHVEDDMWKNAYGSSEEMTVEWLNNLCTIMYFRDNLPPLAPYFTGELRDRGFIWLPRSVQFMENFYESRDKYSQIDSFMPQLVEFFRYTADNFDQVTFEFEHRRPYVVNVFPANGSNILNGDFTEINVTFSKPMTTDCYNVGIVENDGTIAKLPRSETINSYWKDPYTFIIPIEPSFLEKGKKYGLVLDHKGFMSKNLDMLEKDYILLYNTQEK